MKQYEIRFSGKKKGALGVLQYFTALLEAENDEAAILKLYDTHEHITVHAFIELGHEKPVYIIP